MRDLGPEGERAHSADLHSFKIQSEGVQEFLDTHSRINRARQDKMTVLLSFIKETSDGRYTVSRPEVSQVIYKRLSIQEQDSDTPVEEEAQANFLGVSFA